MTDKESLREKFDKEFSGQTPLSQAILGALEYRGFYDAGKYLDEDIATKISPIIIDFFWNEIEQIRKEDMERVVEKIEKLDYRDFEKGKQFVTKEEVLSIIKQTHE